jgi:hypothetical protein
MPPTTKAKETQRMPPTTEPLRRSFLSICAFFPKKDPAAGEPGGRCLIGHPRFSTQLPASHFALTAV